MSSEQKGRWQTSTTDGRKAGENQVDGRTGSTLTKKDIEKKLRIGKYVHQITSIGKEEGEYIKKYVLDFKVILVINEIRIYQDKNGEINIPTEYKSNVTYGPFLKAAAVDLESVMSNDRICRFINKLTGDMLGVCAGSIYGFCKNFARITGEWINKIENELLNQETVCTDATVVTMNGKQGYIRNSSSNSVVLYAAMEKKSWMHLMQYLSWHLGGMKTGVQKVNN